MVTEFDLYVLKTGERIQVNEKVGQFKMAKKVSTTKRVTKKRVKKNVERGQAHIQSSFNNTNRDVNRYSG